MRTICRVRLEGSRDENPLTPGAKVPEKLAARKRTVLWMADVGDLLDAFLLDCIERELPDDLFMRKLVYASEVKALAVLRAHLNTPLTRARRDAINAAHVDYLDARPSAAGMSRNMRCARKALNEIFPQAARDAPYRFYAQYILRALYEEDMYGGLTAGYHAEANAQLESLLFALRPPDLTEEQMK